MDWMNFDVLLMNCFMKSLKFLNHKLKFSCFMNFDAKVWTRGDLHQWNLGAELTGRSIFSNHEFFWSPIFLKPGNIYPLI